MSADYENLFKPVVDESDSSADELAPIELPPVDDPVAPVEDVPPGPLTASAQAPTAAPTAPGQPEQIGGPPRRPAARSWPEPPAASRGWADRPVIAHDDAEASAATQGTQIISGAATNRPAAAPASYGDGRTEIVNVWPVNEAMANVPEQTSAASIGNHRAIDALSHVDVKTSVKMPPQRGWRHILYVLTRINLGLSPDEIYEMDLHTRIRRNARDSYQIGVFGLKGGVGKTAVTVALGSTLSKVRGDRILAVDADPDAGNLADRCGRESAATISDLLADRNLSRYNDIRSYTSMNRSNLEVLSSDEYSVARRPFGPDEWDATVNIVSRYYNLVLADCGAGLFHPAARGVLNTVSGLVIVASASIDGARQAAVTMDWLRQNGYQHLLGRTCVVINHIVPGKPNIDVDDLVQQFQRHVNPGRVVVLPFDKHIAAGTAIDLDLLGSVFQRRVTELAAALSDDFERLERR